MSSQPPHPSSWPARPVSPVIGQIYVTCGVLSLVAILLPVLVLVGLILLAVLAVWAVRRRRRSTVNATRGTDRYS